MIRVMYLFLWAWLYGFLIKDKKPDIRDEKQIRARLDIWKDKQRKKKVR